MINYIIETIVKLLKPLIINLINSWINNQSVNTTNNKLDNYQINLDDINHIKQSLLELEKSYLEDKQQTRQNFLHKDVNRTGFYILIAFSLSGLLISIFMVIKQITHASLMFITFLLLTRDLFSFYFGTTNYNMETVIKLYMMMEASNDKKTNQ